MKILLDAIKAVELSHFRTENDTGANPNALMIMNAFRRQANLPRIYETDLPYYNEELKGYYMPENSNLLCAPEILARGGKV